LTILLFVGVLQCLAALHCCKLFVWKIEHQESTVLSFSFFSCNHRRSQGGKWTIPLKFQTYLVIVFFDRQGPTEIPLLAFSHSIWPSQKILGWQTACISLAPSHVPQYQTLGTALPYLMFNLPLTKTSQQRKTASHSRTPMKSNILIFILRSKQYYRVA